MQVKTFQSEKIVQLQKRHYGWLPELPDPRDLRYKIRKPTIDGILLSTENRAKLKLPAIFDQGQLGSCTGNAWALALTLLVLNKHAQNRTSISMPFSRLFIYYLERLLEGTVNEDSGAFIRDGIKAVAKWGCCSEKAWKYDINKFAKQPSKTAFKSAEKYQALQYARIDNTNNAEIVDCLSHGFPIVFGFSVFESFESDEVARTGIVPMPDLAIEAMLGGHAVTLLDHDKDRGGYWCVNSWGEAWGDHGWFFMPYAYINNPDLADDFWTVQVIE